MASAGFSSQRFRGLTVPKHIIYNNKQQKDRCVVGSYGNILLNQKEVLLRMTTAHYLNLQAPYKWKKEEDKGRIWDRAEEPPYLAQTSVLWQHYGNIIFSLQPKELDRLTASIYIQRRPFSVTWNTEKVCINTEQYLCFPVIQLLAWNRKHCAESLIFMLSICREAFTDQWFYRIVDFFPLHGFLHDLVNATIEWICLAAYIKYWVKYRV